MTENDIRNSGEAVRRFLISANPKLINGGTVTCLCIEEHGSSEMDLYVSHVPHLPSYNLDDDIFKSYGLRNPLWSAYFLFEWDEQNEMLIINVDRHRTIKFKRI